MTIEIPAEWIEALTRKETWLAVWLVGVALAFIPASRWLHCNIAPRADCCDETPGDLAIDRVMSLLLGAIVSLGWPLLLAAYLAYALSLIILPRD